MKVKLLQKTSSIALVLALLSSHHVFAMDLKTALETTYNNNEDFKSRQVEFLSSVENFSVAMAKFLPTVSASIKRQDSKAQNNSAPGVGVLNKSIDVQQNLFNSGGDAANLRAAQAIFKAAKYAFYQNEQAVIYSALEAYLNYLEAKKICDINEANVNYSQKVFDATSAKLQVGEERKTSLAIAEANLYAAKSQRLKSLADLEVARGNFKQVIGVDPQDIKDVELPQIEQDFKDFVAKVKANNFAINYAKHSLEASKSRVVEQFTNLLPSVSAFASWSKVHYDKEDLTPFVNRVNRSDFTTALTLNIPILPAGGAAYSQIRSAKNVSRQKAFELEKAIKKSEADVYSSWEAYKSMNSSLMAANAAVSAQKIAVAGTNQEFDLGLKTIVDVLKAESDLVSQQNQQAQVYTKCVLAAYRLKLLAGDITAQKLNLKVKLFNPDTEFRKIKMKIIGF